MGDYGKLMFRGMMELPGNYQEVFQVEISLPPTLNQSYKIVKIQGFSRLSASLEAREHKDMVAIMAFQALTGE